ncbi:COP9 signalosome complex subunit 9 [Eumeta japonica]|uniref:COP9 signalosome complex subunit 9 n=1 Tax=Eumeta variegata TaxID=151549 RepID=A0A4C1YKJ5_EUMVA|nr:COP9 signalosome complex subunit 9 [Eumeta japonica]
MKPTVAADEMFPEGVGPYMDIEEMFKTLQAGGPSNLLMDLAANEKAVHADFFNEIVKFLMLVDHSFVSDMGHPPALDTEASKEAVENQPSTSTC